MTKNEAKANIMEIANKEGRKIAISELPKTFVVEGQEVVCSDGRFRSDDRHFWPNGVKPAAGDKTTNGTTTKRTTGKRTIKKAAAVKMLQQRIIVGRVLTSDFCSGETKTAARNLANKRKQAHRVECASNQYNEQLQAKAAAKKAREERAAAAATVAADNDLLLRIMKKRAAAGDPAATAYLASLQPAAAATAAKVEATTAATAKKAAKKTAKKTA